MCVARFWERFRHEQFRWAMLMCVVMCPNRLIHQSQLVKICNVFFWHMLLADGKNWEYVPWCCWWLLGSAHWNVFLELFSWVAGLTKWIFALQKKMSQWDKSLPLPLMYSSLCMLQILQSPYLPFANQVCPTLPHFLPTCMPAWLPASLHASLTQSLTTPFSVGLPVLLPSDLPASLPAHLPASIHLLHLSVHLCFPTCLLTCLPACLPALVPPSLNCAVHRNERSVDISSCQLNNLVTSFLNPFVRNNTPAWF